jgi:uncharacterized protein with GYD domain
MTTYIFYGRYTMDALKGMSPERADTAVEAIEQCGGQVEGMYATLGKYDLVFILSFPSVEDAMKCSVVLARITGITFTSSPAVPVEQFDQMMSDL